MKDAQRAHILNLHEWIKRPFLQRGGTKCLPQIMPIFVKVDYPSVKINQHPNS